MQARVCFLKRMGFMLIPFLFSGYILQYRMPFVVLNERPELWYMCCLQSWHCTHAHQCIHVCTKDLLCFLTNDDSRRYCCHGSILGNRQLGGKVKHKMLQHLGYIGMLCLKCLDHINLKHNSFCRTLPSALPTGTPFSSVPVQQLWLVSPQLWLQPTPMFTMLIKR